MSLPELCILPTSNITVSYSIFLQTLPTTIAVPAFPIICLYIGTLSAFLLYSRAVPLALIYIHPCHSIDFPSYPCISGASLPSSFRSPQLSHPFVSGSCLLLRVFEYHLGNSSSFSAISHRLPLNPLIDTIIFRKINSKPSGQVVLNPCESLLFCQSNAFA